MLLVTGASGHSGKWFFKRLAQEHYQGKIRCLVRETSRVDHLKKSELDLEFVYGDLNDTEVIERAMIDVKTVLHIAGITFSKRLVPIGAKAGVEWFILVHTTGRYSRYKSASAGYIETEDSLLRDYQNLTILRPTMIYGSSSDHNMWKLINFIHRHKFFPVFGSGRNLMQPVHAKDLGDAYYAVLNNKNVTFGKQYNLSGRDEITYLDILKAVAKNLQLERVFVHIPMWLSLSAARLYNFVFGTKAIISVEQVMRMNEDKVFSWEQAHKDFGYQPLSFDEGIRLEINELLDSNNNNRVNV